eukprot:scaffold274626_cov17-Tisochrysis_lutea.AAC.1
MLRASSIPLIHPDSPIFRELCNLPPPPLHVWHSVKIAWLPHLRIVKASRPPPQLVSCVMPLSSLLSCILSSPTLDFLLDFSHKKYASTLPSPMLGFLTQKARIQELQQQLAAALERSRQEVQGVKRKKLQQQQLTVASERSKQKLQGVKQKIRDIFTAIRKGQGCAKGGAAMDKGYASLRRARWSVWSSMIRRKKKKISARRFCRGAARGVDAFGRQIHIIQEAEGLLHGKEPPVLGLLYISQRRPERRSACTPPAPPSQYSWLAIHRGWHMALHCQVGMRGRWVEREACWRLRLEFRAWVQTTKSACFFFLFFLSSPHPGPNPDRPSNLPFIKLPFKL